VAIGLGDPVIRKQFFKPQVTQALFSFKKYIGYGLFILEKEGRES